MNSENRPVYLAREQLRKEALNEVIVFMGMQVAQGQLTDLEAEAVVLTAMMNYHKAVARDIAEQLEEVNNRITNGEHE